MISTFGTTWTTAPATNNVTIQTNIKSPKATTTSAARM